MIPYNTFCTNCKTLKHRVELACSACKRNSSDVKILPVTKTHPLEAIEYSAEFGFDAVGENKVQEAVAKIQQAQIQKSKALSVNCELIGHLQTNKAKKAVEYFARIQSVDSIKLLEKIDAEAKKLDKKQRILLQINAGRDPAKFGAEIEEAPALLERALQLNNLTVEGLMTIAPLDENLDSARRCFANLREIRDELSEKFAISLSELSMGMSHDLEIAIEEGSTMIRVGTFLFGERHYL